MPGESLCEDKIFALRAEGEGTGHWKRGPQGGAVCMANLTPRCLSSFICKMKIRVQNLKVIL